MVSDNARSGEPERRVSGVGLRPELIGRLSGIAFEHVIYSKGLSLESILAASVSNEEAEATWERVSVRRGEDEKRRGTLAKLAAAGYTLTVTRG